MYQISRLNGVVFNFLDKKDVRFKELHNTIEFICSTLHSQGLGSSVNSAAAVSVEDEEQLLDKEVLSMDNSTNLHYMVFFYVGIHCLRGGQEQQSLQINQFTCHPANVNE